VEASESATLCQIGFRAGPPNFSRVFFKREAHSTFEICRACEDNSPDLGRLSPTKDDPGPGADSLRGAA